MNKPLVYSALLLNLLLATSCQGQAAAGAALLRKAEALDQANSYDAAETAYNQASQAFGKAHNTTGQQQALTELAAMDERKADLLLSQLPGHAPADRPATAVAAVARPVARLAVVAGPAPMAGRMVGGKPVGLFFFMSVFNEQRTYYFTPAGQVYVDPASFSAAGLAALAPNWRGTFTINGTQMSIHWANGETKTANNYHFDPTGFGWEGSFICLTPFASARQLLGTFEGRNAAVSVDANSNVLFRTFHFKADGTFTRDNFAAAYLETTTGFTSDASAASAQAGHWQLSGWALTLSDNRGTVSGIAFPTAMDDKTGTAMYFRFNGTTYSNTAR